jgi:hypothetical protein
MTGLRSSWNLEASGRGTGERVQTLVDIETLQASRLARLGGAIEGLARDLAQARREVKRLRKENAVLRRSLDDPDSNKSAASGRGMPRNRDAEILAMVRQQQVRGQRRPAAPRSGGLKP